MKKIDFNYIIIINIIITMFAINAQTNNNGNQFFVLDESKHTIINTIISILKKNKNKKIRWNITEATDEDVERYGGICDLDVFEYVIERVCLINEKSYLINEFVIR